MLIYKCLHCDEEKDSQEPTEDFVERGWLHHECLTRLVVGSAAHQLKECSCYGGTREDPPGLSRRDAARLAQGVLEALARENTKHQ